MGIDPISQVRKVCTIDCIYCQIGKTRSLTYERKNFIPVREVIEELDSLPNLKVDYITFSGRGEPTLAKNLGQMIKAVKKIRREKIAVLTNSSLMHREDVREDLFSADFVVAKLDAHSQDIFEKVNRPLGKIKFNTILEAIKNFKRIFKGKLALQIMFIEENKKYAFEIAQIAKEIGPQEVQINTPLRPCGVEPLQKKELANIKDYFAGLNTVSVYEISKKNIKPISDKDTLVRRGKIR